MELGLRYLAHHYFDHSMVSTHILGAADQLEWRDTRTGIAVAVPYKSSNCRHTTVSTDMLASLKRR